MSAASYDRASGIITLTGGDGVNSPESIQARTQEMVDLITRGKAEKGYVRILRLASELPVQSQDTAGAASQAMAQQVLTDPRDRFAMVINSTLARMQFNRVSRDENVKVFATEAEARAWLLSD